MPSSLSPRMTRKSWSTSDASRLEVGSSSTSTLASTSSARAMATICCTAIEWVPRSEPTSMESCSRPSSSSARRRTADQWIRPNRVGARPISTFSATERLGQRLISW